MQNPKLVRLVQNGLIAAIYTVLGLVLAPISFGVVQLRIPEALTLLPVLMPSSVWGLTLGCAITNLIGSYSGANFLGIADVFIGAGATMLAALLTALLGRYRWRGLPLLASLPPVLVNAVVIGAEWCWVTTGSLSPLAIAPFALMIGAGQLLSCTLIGVPLTRYLERSGALNKFTQKK